MNRRIFKINNTLHEEFCIIEKESDKIFLKIYVYGVLSHSDNHNISILNKQYPDNENFTIEKIVSLENPYFVNTEKHLMIQRTQEASNKRWNSFFEKIKNILIVGNELTDKVYFNNNIGFVIQGDLDSWYGKRIVKGFDSIIDIYFEDYISPEQANESLGKLIENYRKNKEKILERIKLIYEEVKADFDDGDKDFFPDIDNIEDLEKHLNFNSITLDDDSGILHTECPWDEEHGIEVEFNNDSKISMYGYKLSENGLWVEK